MFLPTLIFKEHLPNFLLIYYFSLQMRYYYEQPNEISGTLRRNAAIKDLLQRIFVSSQFSLLISKE